MAGPPDAGLMARRRRGTGNGGSRPALARHMSPRMHDGLCGRRRSCAVQYGVRWLPPRAGAMTNARAILTAYTKGKVGPKGAMAPEKRVAGGPLVACLTRPPRPRSLFGWRGRRSRTGDAEARACCVGRYLHSHPCSAQLRSGASGWPSRHSVTLGRVVTLSPSSLRASRRTSTVRPLILSICRL